MGYNDTKSSDSAETSTACTIRRGIEEYLERKRYREELGFDDFEFAAD